MVFFAFISFLLFWIKNKRYEAVKYLIAVPLVCFYVAVAGAPTSAVRAAVMFSFLALGMIVQKNKQPLNQLFATAFFMLLYEPMWLFAVGFQLSFIAVLSLILFYQPVSNWWVITNRFYRALWQAMAASIAAEILVAPLVIFYYHLLPTMFLFANLFAYLFMGAVLILGLVLVLVSKVAFLAKILATIITFIVVIFNGLVTWFQSLNPDFLRHLYLSLQEIFLVYLAITCFAIFIMKKIGTALLLGQFAILLLLVSISMDNRKALQQQKLIVYYDGKKNYAELLSGEKYFPLFQDTVLNADKDFATKEAHIALRSWKKGAVFQQPILSIKGKKFLFLNKAVGLDSFQKIPIDYLVLNYPVKKYNANDLKKVFCFEKLILAGNQKRYLMEQWKDSCAHHNIPAHFVMLDGAFVFE
jgi:competence protein ComEC